MARILILYGTGEGQTRQVAGRMAEVIREKGHEVEVVKGNRAPADFSPQGFDAAIIGTSIHMGLHQISVRQLVREHREAFARIPVAYFCVCMTAVSDKPRDKEQVERYIDDFQKYTGIRPLRTAVFAGALKYPYYNFIKRFVLKLVARRLGASTDTSREHEYTDWKAVTDFALEFQEMVGKRNE